MVRNLRLITLKNIELEKAKIILMYLRRDREAVSMSSMDCL